MGINYALANWDKNVSTYPYCDNGLGGDCANFVSQCMLAGGVHYQGDWWVYKKNNTYLEPTNTTELNYSWNLTSPSPWISAKYFNRFWAPKVTTNTYLGQYILDHPSEIYQLNYYKGDVIQVLGSNILGPTEAWHTMYITGYKTYNGNATYSLTYHSNYRTDITLLEWCELYPDQYFRFFTIN